MRGRVATRIECLREALEAQLGDESFLKVYKLARQPRVDAPSPCSTLSLDEPRARIADRMLQQLIDFEDLFYGEAAE